MKTRTLLGLMAHTSIHAGSGQASGVTDLPIQREGHNGWPCVFGSSVKGALRADAEDKLGAASHVVTSIFGPSTGSVTASQASDFAGAIRISDARLLLFPVRSLTSQFKWVTCPAALQRFEVDLLRFDRAPPTPFRNDIKSLIIANDEVLIHQSDPEESAAGNQALFLEEYRFSIKSQNLTEVIKPLSALMSAGNALSLLEAQLVIVSNDSFAQLVQQATPVNAHIAIDNKTKSVQPGALWYEETLSPETLLYIGLDAVKTRAPKASGNVSKGQPLITADDIPQLSGDEVLGAVLGLFDERPWLQIGGNETAGMGWCHVKEMPETKVEPKTEEV